MTTISVAKYPSGASCTSNPTLAHARLPECSFTEAVDWQELTGYPGLIQDFSEWWKWLADDVRRDMSSSGSE